MGVELQRCTGSQRFPLRLAAHHRFFQKLPPIHAGVLLTIRYHSMPLYVSVCQPILFPNFVFNFYTRIIRMLQAYQMSAALEPYDEPGFPMRLPLAGPAGKKNVVVAQLKMLVAFVVGDEDLRRICCVVRFVGDLTSERSIALDRVQFETVSGRFCEVERFT